MEKHDLEIIYEQLKDKYDLVLTNTFSLDDGYTIDVKVLCGKTSIGRFHLYKENDAWDEFVFSVEYAQVKPGEEYTHWHPQSRNQAMRDVVAFMEGRQVLHPSHELSPIFEEFPSPT